MFTNLRPKTHVAYTKPDYNTASSMGGTAPRTTGRPPPSRGFFKVAPVRQPTEHNWLLDLLDLDYSTAKASINRARYTARIVKVDDVCLDDSVSYQKNEILLTLQTQQDFKPSGFTPADKMRDNMQVSNYVATNPTSARVISVTRSPLTVNQ